MSTNITPPPVSPSGTATVPNGGTGVTTMTTHGVVLGQGASAVHVTAAGTAGQALVSGGAGADPAFGIATVVGGGTGLATLTAHSLYVGEGTSVPTALGAATNGQLPIGSTGADPVLAAITAGHGVVVTNGAGSIAVASTTTIADPGNAGAIPITATGVCNLVTAGAETRTVAAPTFVGQTLFVNLDTKVGNAVVTVSNIFDGTNNTVTMSAAGQSIGFIGVTIASALKWALVANNGTALSHV